MKKDDLIVTVGAGCFGASLGFLLSTTLSTAPWKIALSSLGTALPVFGVTGFVVDNRATAKISKLDEVLGQKKAEIIRLRRVENLNRELLSDLQAYKNRLEKKELEITGSKAFVETQNQGILAMKGEIEKLKSTIASYQSRINELEEEIQQWMERFDNDFDDEVDAKLAELKQNQIAQICTEDFTVVREASDLSNSYRNLILLASEEVRIKNDLVRQLAQEFNEKIGNYDSAFTKERDEYLSIIENYKIQIALLQKEAKGELLEPEYTYQGYDIPSQIAADFCREIWNTHQIPLRLEGVSGTPDGVMNAGYGYGANQSPDALVGFIKSQSEYLCKALGIHKITRVEKLAIAPVIAVSFRREPALKQDEIKLLLGTGEEFLDYVVNHPIRYRLIADPGTGKTPTTAVMLASILKHGCKMGNVPSGQKVPHALIDVSYPDRHSSIKDEEYPLDRFLKFATTTEAVKSFDEAIKEREYRKKHLEYAKQVFQIYCWDEFDNTISSASSPKDVASDLKKLLKDGGHSNIGWILSGQSVMTRQIPGFTNDDRSLFTEIIIGIPKIRKYLQAYGRKLGEKSNTQLLNNLDNIESYVSNQNKLITDSARLLRVALVVDSKSPKLFFLPNLDLAIFDEQTISNSQKVACQLKRTPCTEVVQMTKQPKTVTYDSREIEPVPFLCTESPMEGSVTSVQNSSKPHCPSCGSSEIGSRGKKRFSCKNQSCKRQTFARSKAIWK